MRSRTISTISWACSASRCRENPGVVIQDAAFAAMGLERWHFLTLDVDRDKLEDALRGLKAFKMRGVNCTIPPQNRRDAVPWTRSPRAPD